MVELILCKSRSLLILAAALILYTPAAQAQIQSVDPNEVIDADIVDPPDQDGTNASEQSQEPMHEELPAPQTDEAPGTVQGATDTSTTYQKKDVLSAAEEVFGKGAEGLAYSLKIYSKNRDNPMHILWAARVAAHSCSASVTARENYAIRLREIR